MSGHTDASKRRINGLHVHILTDESRRPKKCLCGNHIFAATSRWGVVLVSPKDGHLLEGYYWSLVYPKNDRRPPYAMSGKYRRDNNTSEKLHHAVMGSRGMVDHVNGNGLDNRTHNIRPATHAQNIYNNRCFRKSLSGFKGVYPNKGGKAWSARVTKDGTRYYLGSFDDVSEAARAYDAKAIELYGEYARLNRPTVLQ